MTLKKNKNNTTHSLLLGTKQTVLTHWSTAIKKKKKNCSHRQYERQNQHGNQNDKIVHFCQIRNNRRQAALQPNVTITLITRKKYKLRAFICSDFFDSMSSASSITQKLYSVTLGKMLFVGGVVFFFLLFSDFVLNADLKRWNSYDFLWIKTIWVSKIIGPLREKLTWKNLGGGHRHNDSSGSENYPSRLIIKEIFRVGINMSSHSLTSL